MNEPLRTGWMPRRLARFLLATASVLILLCAGGGWWWFSRPDFGDAVRGIGGRFRSESMDTGGAAILKVLSGSELTVYHWIDLQGSGVDDEWLHAHREEFSRASHVILFLRETDVTGDGLSALRGLPNLNYLDLTGTPLSDADIAHLTAIPNLAQFYVAHTGVSDSALAGLSGMPSLAHVCIDSTQATPAGIAGLAACPRLGSVTLLDANDDSVARVAQLNGLIGLMIEGEQVTGDCLPDLQRMQGLQVLTFVDVILSESDVQALQQALPGCSVQQLESAEIEQMRNSLWEQPGDR